MAVARVLSRLSLQKMEGVCPPHTQNTSLQRNLNLVNHPGVAIEKENMSVCFLGSLFQLESLYLCLGVVFVIDGVAQVQPDPGKAMAKL